MSFALYVLHHMTEMAAPLSWGLMAYAMGGIHACINPYIHFLLTATYLIRVMGVTVAYPSGSLDLNVNVPEKS